MLNIINFFEKYIFTYDNFIAMIVMFLSLCLMKTSADVDKLKTQAISHGFAKYDEIKGNWRWITEEDMLK